MICKTSLSSIFKGIPITPEFIQATLGKPVVYKGKQIGVLSMIEPDTDTLRMDIDDSYREEFEKDSRITFVDGPANRIFNKKE